MSTNVVDRTTGEILATVRSEIGEYPGEAVARVAIRTHNWTAKGLTVQRDGQELANWCLPALLYVDGQMYRYVHGLYDVVKR